MRRFMLLLLVLMGSVWLGLLIVKDPGLAYFSYRHWSVEMPLWLAGVFLFVILALLYFLLNLVSEINSVMFRFNNWLRWRRQYKSFSKTHRGLIALIENQWQLAENYLAEGVERSNAKLINYLALAKAAHEQKAYDRRDKYLQKAHAIAPAADVAIGIAQAEMQLDQGSLEQSLATLHRIQRLAPTHPRVLTLLERVYIHLGDWQNLLTLLPKLYKANIINREQLLNFEKKVYIELLQAEKNPAQHALTLESVWKKIPRKCQKEPDVVYAYVSQCVFNPARIVEIEALVFKTLKKHWHSGLARLYGVLNTADPKKHLVHAEQLLKLYPNEPVLLLALARISMQCQLWGKAKRYFTESLTLKAQTEVYVEYAKLLEQLGDNAGAMVNYRTACALQETL